MWKCSKCATQNWDTETSCHRCGTGISPDQSRVARQSMESELKLPGASQYRGPIKSLSQMQEEAEAARPKPGQNFCPRCKTYAWFNRESHTTTTGAVGIPVLGGTVFRPIQSTSSTLRCSNCGGDVMAAYDAMSAANKTDEQRQAEAEGERFVTLGWILFFTVGLFAIVMIILSGS